MNMVFDGKELRCINANEENTYYLEDIILYVPSSINAKQYFLVIKSEGKIDSVPLTLSNSTSKRYFNYVCSLERPVKNFLGKCQISVLSIDDKNSEEIKSSNFVDLFIDSSAFNYKSRLAFSETSSKKLLSMYDEIVKIYKNMIEISKINIEAIKDKEG